MGEGADGNDVVVRNGVAFFGLRSVVNIMWCMMWSMADVTVWSLPTTRLILISIVIVRNWNMRYVWFNDILVVILSCSSDSF